MPCGLYTEQPLLLEELFDGFTLARSKVIETKSLLERFSQLLGVHEILCSDIGSGAVKSAER